ncbi:MAG: L,D-transpeptidase family protein [Pseudorhodoplanes sp.]
MLSKSGFPRVRKAVYLAGVAVLGVMGLAGFGLNPEAQARENAGLFAQFQPQPGNLVREPSGRQQQRLSNRSRQVPQQAIKGGSRQAEKKAPPPPPGPHLLIVSIKSQRITLYANGKQAATSPISSGTPQNPTPHGVFSIIQRNRHHRSNIYSGAPMPYMQRLTWSGIALHQGALPGHPASHGCIRLPESFANFLWNTTKMNTRVIVAREDVEPRDIVHAKLFQPKMVPTTVESPMQEMRKTFDTTHQGFVRTAGMQMVITDAALAEEERGEGKPLVTQPEAEENAARIQAPDAQPTLQSAEEKPTIVEVKPAEPQAPASEPAKQEVAAPQPAPQPEVKQEIAAPQPAPAVPAKPELAGSGPIKPEPKADDITATVIPQPIDIPDSILSSFEKSLAAKAKRVGPTGPISVFISRKDKRLYVRQAFIPLFSANVTLKDENLPFGTHVFTAYDSEDGKSLRWTAITMPAEAAVAEKVKTTFMFDARGRRVEVPVKSSKPAETHSGAVPSAASVLDRIEIPQDVIERISYYMGNGASLILADQGMGNETGLYTDFIVVTKK